MKSKIIAIVVTIVFVAGAGTGIYVVTDKNNEKRTADLVNEAVSQALATTETTSESTTVPEPVATTEETTTEETTSETTSSTAKRKTTTKKRTTTKRRTTKKTTTTQPSVIYKSTSDTEVYFLYEYKQANINGNIVMVYIVKGKGPNVGKYCYKDNEKTIYIDDISTIEFVEESTNQVVSIEQN